MDQPTYSEFFQMLPFSQSRQSSQICSANTIVLTSTNKQCKNERNIYDYCKTILSVEEIQDNSCREFDNYEEQRRVILKQVQSNNPQFKHNRQIEKLSNDIKYKNNQLCEQKQEATQNPMQKIRKIRKNNNKRESELLERINRIKRIISQNIQLRTSTFQEIKIRTERTMRKQNLKLKELEQNDNKTIRPEQNLPEVTKKSKILQPVYQMNSIRKIEDNQIKTQQQQLNTIKNYINKSKTLGQLQSFLIKILLLDSQLLKHLNLFPIQFKELISSLTQKQAQQIYPIAKYINSLISTSKKVIKDDDILHQAPTSIAYENWKQQAGRCLLQSNNEWKKRRLITEYQSVILKQGYSQIVHILKKIVKQNRIQTNSLLFQILQYRVKNDEIVLTHK